MKRNSNPPSKCDETYILSCPIISKTMHRDTLDRVAYVIELLEYMDLSDGMSPNAQSGLYWIHRMIIDSVKYVSDNIKVQGEKGGGGINKGSSKKSV